MVHHLSVLILLIRCYSFKFLIRLYILVTFSRIQFQETKFIKSEQEPQPISTILDKFLSSDNLEIEFIKHFFRAKY